MTRTQEFSAIMLGIYIICLLGFLNSIFPDLEGFISTVMFILVIGVPIVAVYRRAVFEYKLFKDINDPVEKVIERHKKEGLM